VEVYSRTPCTVAVVVASTRALCKVAAAAEVVVAEVVEAEVEVHNRFPCTVAWQPQLLPHAASSPHPIEN